MDLQYLLELAVKVGPTTLLMVLGYLLDKALIEQGFDLSVPPKNRRK